MSKSWCIRSVLLVWILNFAQPASAGNTSLGGVAAPARAVGNAFTAIADDASAIYYNPAGLVQVDGTQLLVDFVSVHPKPKYDAGPAGSTTSSKGSYGPSMFLSTDKISRAKLGIGLFSPFARRDSYKTSAATAGLRHEGDFVRIDLAPTVAFALGRDWAVGLGVTASRSSLSADVLGFRETAHGYGFSEQLGVLYRGIDRWQIGVSYRGKMRARVDGHGAINALSISDHSHASILRYPEVLSGGVAWNVSDRWMMAASADWEGWHYLNEFRREYDNPVLKSAVAASSLIKAKNSWSFRAGTKYSMGAMNINLGYSYQQRAVPRDRIIPAQPDFTAQVLSAGLGGNVGRYKINLSYEYGWSPVERSHGVFPGSYSVRAHVLSLSIGMKLGE